MVNTWNLKLRYNLFILRKYDREVVSSRCFYYSLLYIKYIFTIHIIYTPIHKKDLVKLYKQYILRRVGILDDRRYIYVSY